MKKVNPNILLAEELESGNWTQCTDRLGKGKRRCPLGVACEVYKRVANPGFKIPYSEQLPPAQVVAWYGWTDDNPVIQLARNRISQKVTIFNDVYEEPFDRIAIGFRTLAARQDKSRVSANSK